MVVERKTIDRSTRGKLAETSARDALLREGLKQVAANVNYRGGELDLVMIEAGPDTETLVFVEVRYRAGAAFGGGFASVDRNKRRKLVRAAQLYLGPRPRLARLPCRFDVVEASGDPAAPQLHWMKDAFRLDDV